MKNHRKEIAEHSKWNETIRVWEVSTKYLDILQFPASACCVRQVGLSALGKADRRGHWYHMESNSTTQGRQRHM